jgi:hypothetical protein
MDNNYGLSHCFVSEQHRDDYSPESNQEGLIPLEHLKRPGSAAGSPETQPKVPFGINCFKPSDDAWVLNAGF